MHGLIGVNCLGTAQVAMGVGLTCSVAAGVMSCQASQYLRGCHRHVHASVC